MMTKPAEAVEPEISAKDRIIVALDVDSADEARRVSAELRGLVGGFKIGLQLFTAAGPELVKEFVGDHQRVFLDLKFHDIPNTVAKAAVEAAKLGVWMFNIHAGGGSEMMRRTVGDVDAACTTVDIARPLIIAVTVLTSSDAGTMNEIGVADAVEDQVVRLARLTAECGLDGVVVSPREVPLIRRAIADRSFLTITPGIRPLSATDDDQRRVTTFRQAIENGSDYVVIGRPIVGAADRAGAAEQIAAEIERLNK
ncbi:orotidine-5'-phosphate decarboxylase [soil metagenome]